MSIETVHMPLLNEGTNVWRPVSAETQDDGAFRILGPVPEGEEWAYQPGEVVKAKHHVFADGTEGFVAESAADVSPPIRKLPVGQQLSRAPRALPLRPGKARFLAAIPAHHPSQIIPPSAPSGTHPAAAPILRPCDASKSQSIFGQPRTRAPSSNCPEGCDRMR
jgi:hypothetical protein